MLVPHELHPGANMNNCWGLLKVDGMARQQHAFAVSCALARGLPLYDIVCYCVDLAVAVCVCIDLSVCIHTYICTGLHMHDCTFVNECTNNVNICYACALALSVRRYTAKSSARTLNVTISVKFCTESDR